MEKNTNDNSKNLFDGELSVDAIIAEYKAEELMPEPELLPRQEHSEQIFLETDENAFGEAKISSTLDFIESQSEQPEEKYVDTTAEEIPPLTSLYPDEPAEKKEKSLLSLFTGKDEPEEEKDLFDDKSDTRRIFPVKKQEDINEENEENFWEDQAVDTTRDVKYASHDDYESEQEDKRHSRPTREVDLKEKVLTPIVALLSASSMKREEKRKKELEQRKATEKKQPPELSPSKASSFYASQAQSLRLRCFFASAVCLVLIYLSYGLPAMGALGKSTAIRALMCLVLELVVMLIGLDVFTNGITSLFRKKPGAESLIAVSCIVSAIDALFIAFSGNSAVGLPFCAVSALSVTFALWGSYLSCAAFSISFATAAAAKTPSVILSQSGIDEDGCVLSKSKRPVTGFVRQTESADIFESSYRLFAPVLLVAALVLSLFCFLASKQCTDFVHTFSAATSVAASFSSVFGFAFPFAMLTKRLARSGVAIAGYSGSAELGRIRRVMITDTDVFPVRTVSIADIAVPDGESPERVISYTASMIAAAGMGIAPVFTELMRKNGCSLRKVEDFACHEGGGILARIDGDTVYVGSSGFMKLMGVRLPKNANTKTAVFTAINDSLSGVFVINYSPVSTVQRALVTLLRGRNEPLFAVRDFSITPMLIKQKFRLPSGSYDFPSFADRYRISSVESESKGKVCAMFARGGLNAVSGLISRGRKLYNGLRISLALSILGAILGMVIILSLCWSGSYSSANCGNLMTFMLLWLVPVFVISMGLKR